MKIKLFIIKLIMIMKINLIFFKFKIVTSVFYIFSKIDFFLISHFFNITRLSLACLNKGICIYLNVFFMYIFSPHLVILFNTFI